MITAAKLNRTLNQLRAIESSFDDYNSSQKVSCHVHFTNFADSLLEI